MPTTPQCAPVCHRCRDDSGAPVQLRRKQRLRARVHIRLLGNDHERETDGYIYQCPHCREELRIEVEVELR